MSARAKAAVAVALNLLAMVFGFAEPVIWPQEPADDKEEARDA